MSVHILMNGQTLPLHTFQYAGGEVHTQVAKMQDTKAAITIIARLQSPKDILELLLADEIINRYSNGGKHLIIPYFPYARQDRVTSRDTAFSLKVFCDLINDLQYNSITIYDPHSDVTPALLHNVTIVSQLDMIKGNKGLSLKMPEIDCIVSPDTGAYRKASAVADHYKMRMVVGRKVRDVNTGEITHTEIDGNSIDQHHFMIVDDICDGGKTFTELAKAIKDKKPNCRISLYVTHGIFSKGYAPFKDLIDTIYTTNTFIPRAYPLPGEVPLFTYQVLA